jgi:hypothetical protein
MVFLRRRGISTHRARIARAFRLGVGAMTCTLLAACATQLPDAVYVPQSGNLTASDPGYLPISIAVLPAATANTSQGERARAAGVDLDGVRRALLDELLDSESFETVTRDGQSAYVLEPVVVGVSDLLDNVLHITVSVRQPNTQTAIYSRTIKGGGFSAFTRKRSLGVVAELFREYDLPLIRRAIAAHGSGQVETVDGTLPSGALHTPVNLTGLSKPDARREVATAPLPSDSSLELADTPVPTDEHGDGGTPVDHMIAGAIGGMGAGLGVGLAMCTPTVLVPIAYPICVAAATLTGTASGSVAGVAIGAGKAAANAAPPLDRVPPEPGGAFVAPAPFDHPEGSSVVILAPPMATPTSTDSCEYSGDADWSAAIDGLHRVSPSIAQTAVLETELVEIWDSDAISVRPSTDAVKHLPAFQDADAVMLVAYDGRGGGSPGNATCLGMTYYLYLVDRKAGSIVGMSTTTRSPRNHMKLLVERWLRSR